MKFSEIQERFWVGDESSGKDDGFVDHLYAELLHAIDKHGIDQTPLNPKMDPREKIVILGEEYGEVCRAATYDEGSQEQLKKELLQVAAMATAAYISMMDVSGNDA